MNAGRVRPADVIGAPVLPPARAAAAGSRVRSLISRLHRGGAPAPVRVLEGLWGLLDHAGLVALCDLGVPGALTKPTTVAALASDVGADADALERLLRYAAARGWVRLDRGGRVRPTAVTRFLAEDHPGGWRAWVDFAGGTEVVAASGRLADAVRTGGDAFALANGAPFFEWLASHPDRSRAFDGAMAAGGRLHALTLSAAVEWGSTRRVCDVGGGDGTLLRTLLAELPSVEGVLLDLPHVVRGAEPAPRFTAVGGDAFESVPGGCDTYLLVNVVHDWGDDDCVRLLRSVREAAPDGARLIVVEAERAARPTDDIAGRTDLLMLVLAPGGRERTQDEMRDLARAAGWRVERVAHLASADVAYILR